MTKEAGADHIYLFIQTWKETCLLKDGSMLWPGEPIWSLENLSRLKGAFIDKPDVSQRSFMEKLRDQLQGESPSLYQLMIEAICIYKLFPKVKKNQSIRDLAEWGHVNLPDLRELESLFAFQVGSVGTYYSVNKPNEIRQIIMFALDLKAKSPEERVSILENPEQLNDFIHSLQKRYPGKVAMDNALKHFLIPDYYESIVSFGDKELIVKHYGDLIGEKPDVQNIDHQIYQIMQKLKAMHPEAKIDLYRDPWDAWRPVKVPKLPEVDMDDEASGADDGINYWFVGAFWKDVEPKDQTERFISDGIWQNGYEDKFRDSVLSMKPGDKIAIKAAYTRTQGLPFDNEGHTISCMDIRAVGTITGNRMDGQTVEVSWAKDFEPKEWYFYTVRPTVTRINHKNELAKELIRFAFENKLQNYEFFLDYWRKTMWQTTNGTYISGDVSSDESELAEALKPPYSVQDALREGVFMHESELEEYVALLRDKKNLILQGPPGVGKTFLAKKIAYMLMEAKDDDRVKLIQFHQSYSYEDFIQGYRPDENGGFKRYDGPFYKFCKKAQKDSSDTPYVFIIDEINRGNLSQIFGELLMLLEADKRGSKNSIDLMHAKDGKDEPFYVPKNLYVIGMMNIADRSLAMVDYALRRRFAFKTLNPQFDHPRFIEWLSTKKMPQKVVETITSRMNTLNRIISEDKSLGKSFRVGHSYFCPSGDNYSGLDNGWYKRVVQTEILPLLEEYWFDNDQQVKECTSLLLGL